MKILKRVCSLTGVALSPMLMFWTAHLKLAISVMVILIIVVATYVALQKGIIEDTGSVTEVPFKQ